MGTIVVLCMNPLDLLRVKFQVVILRPEGGIERVVRVWRAIADIHASEGSRKLYRCLSPNIPGK